MPSIGLDTIVDRAVKHLTGYVTAPIVVVPCKRGQNYFTIAIKQLSPSLIVFGKDMTRAFLLPEPR